MYFVISSISHISPTICSYLLLFSFVFKEKEHLFNDKQSERRQLEERADKAETQLKSLRDQIAVMLTERGRLVSLSAIDSQVS